MHSRRGPPNGPAAPGCTPQLGPLPELGLHAPAVIDDETNRDWGIGVLKNSGLLRLPVVVDTEVVPRQAPNALPVRVGQPQREQHHFRRNG